MGVTLSKGQKVDLTKSHPGLQNVIVGLGWSINNMGSNFDLDASAFLLGETGKVQSDADFVFYNNPNGGNGSIIYSGDNRVGSGVKDDEQISIDLLKVPSHIHRIAFTITIHDAQVKGQNFGQIPNSYVRIFNKHTNEELVRFDLGRNFTVETAIVAAELYRHNGEWKFNAIASGFQGGLGALCRNFGIHVDDEPAVTSSTTSFQTSGSHMGTPVQQPSFTQSTPVYSTPTATHQTYGGDNISCPNCHSTNIRTGEKGFGLGKAAIGGLILGPIGLLGGFIGRNQLKLTCTNCGKSWSPNQTDYVEWANQQKRRAQELFTRYKSQDVLDAVVAGCALVGMADGRLDPAEREKMLEFVHQSDELRVFETNKVIQKFNYFVGKIEHDQIIGKAEAFKALGKVRTKPEIARLIARYCIAIGYADGHFDQNEKQMVSDICRELGLNPAEFLS
ncbi:TerD family protein [Neobacillus sp. PS3-40]|uniref:TerD family protein n=1 Tax=Neobacillus sp. PS3-40 TaxID=3070679 RepID=UPI0027DF30CE|nr:TerD family protein [Neobacillus sp. PS3-40]WML44115.1 TerD family protein [Neobacillus sp. PS3-40]